MRRNLHYFAAAMAITAPVAAQAEGETASIGVDAMGGLVRDDSEQTGPDDDVTYALLPSAAFGSQLVVQVDTILAKHREDDVFGGALHVGVRVGEEGFVGAYGSRTENTRHTGLALYRLGGEVDFDLGAVELASVAGYEHTERGSFLIRTTGTDDVYDVYDGDGRFFAFSDIRFRPSQNFSFSLGHRFNGGQHAGAASAMFGLGANVAIFAEGRLGENDYDGAFIGLRGRFGGGNHGSSLLDNRLLEDLFAPSNIRSTLGVPLPPPEEEGPGPGCGSCGGYGNCAA